MGTQPVYTMDACATALSTAGVTGTKEDHHGFGTLRYRPRMGAGWAVYELVLFALMCAALGVLYAYTVGAAGQQGA